MFTSILVPLDGSPLAERALPYAEALARAGGARLILFRAAMAHTLPGLNHREAEMAAMAEAEAYLEEVARPLLARGLTVDTAVPYGKAAEMIVEEVIIREADLIVMATHGRSGLGRWVYGSVAEGVLARCAIPVLLVRAWQRAPVAPFGERTRLLVPLDGSAFAEAALPAALALAKVMQGQIDLLRVVVPPDLAMMSEAGLQDYIEQEFEAEEAAARDYLREVAGRPEIEKYVGAIDVRAGMPAYVVGEAGREHGAGLIVMATHGRTGLRRALLGSVADATLRQGVAPVLLVQPAASGTETPRFEGEAPDQTVAASVTNTN